MFGVGKVNEHRNFNWVTTENVLAVYEQLFEVYKDHNHEYTKQEIDEIKLLLVALNERKKELKRSYHQKSVQE